MNKTIRRRVVIEKLEARLEKYGRRMQRISEESYNLRVLLEQLKSQPKQVPLTKAAREEAEKAAMEPIQIVNEANQKAIELDRKIDVIMDEEDKQTTSTNS